MSRRGARGPKKETNDPQAVTFIVFEINYSRDLAVPVRYNHLGGSVMSVSSLEVMMRLEEFKGTMILSASYHL